jgi:GTPase Era involved in 16S rRNA processing
MYLDDIEIHWVHYPNDEQVVLNKFDRRMDRYKSLNTNNKNKTIFLFCQYDFYNTHTNMEHVVDAFALDVQTTKIFVGSLKNKEKINIKNDNFHYIVDNNLPYNNNELKRNRCNELIIRDSILEKLLAHITNYILQNV